MSARVLKFGGTSVGTAERLRRALECVQSATRETRVVVVVSALGGVTDRLEDAVRRCARGERIAVALAAHLRERHEALLAQVAQGEALERATASIESVLTTLGGWLEEVELRRHATPFARAAILATGERLSAPIVAAGLLSRGHDSAVVDASRLLIAFGSPLEANVDLAASEALVRAWWPTAPETPVVTGFVARDREGRTLLLGRGGSDHTATLLAAALSAERVDIFSDTDGVLTADPRLVPQARTLPSLDVTTAVALARLGARVLHPRTLEPTARRGIPVWVRDTRRPERSGTRIPARGPTRDATIIVSGASLALLPLPAGVDAAAWVGSLLAQDVPVLGSSNDSRLLLPATAIGCARDALAARGVTTDLAAELVSEHRVVAVVGSEREAGVAAALRRAGVPLLHPVVRAGRRAVATLVHEDQVAAAVRALHEALAPTARHIDLVLVGARGRVARALRRLLARERGALAEGFGLDLRIVGAIDTRRMVWDEDGLEPAALDESLELGEIAVLEAMLARIEAHTNPARLWVDCTASEAVASSYSRLLAGGIGVVTPNKRANARTFGHWRALQSLARSHGAPYRYGTTVGAALPVLEAIRDLRTRGDRVRSAHAILSGSISYVLGAVQDGIPFSAAVAEAHARGFTEPHPAEDLGGLDVARKLVILLREAGIEVEPSEVRVSPLVRESLRQIPEPEAFLAALNAEDGSWRDAVAVASARGHRLVFLASWQEGAAHVGVTELPLTDPLARVRTGENMVVLRTDHYDSIPLTIAGPGAGPDITAAGIVSDLVGAARQLTFSPFTERAERTQPASA